MKVGNLDFLLLAIFGCFYANSAVFAVTLFSDYGQIQNVQNYSTNPFWTPNSPYNQKTPQPIYVQGTNVSNDECTQIVQAVVAAQCMARNNCKNTTLSDIRPAVIVQLSSLPNKAYGTACIGYLDTIYESYVKQHNNNAPLKQVPFPETLAPNNNYRDNTYSAVTTNTSVSKMPKWEQEIIEKAQELKELQEDNNAGNEHSLVATAFPTTFNDLPFVKRIEVLAKGYAPFKGKSAYRTLDVQTAAQWCGEGENKDNPECVKYRCSKGGPEANETQCITWRCSQKGLETDEVCNLNEKCGGDKSDTDECKLYRCTETNAKDNEWCKRWKCQNGYEDANICLQYNCSIDSFSTATDTCKRYLCEKPGNYETNPTCWDYLCDKDAKYKQAHPDRCYDDPALAGGIAVIPQSQKGGDKGVKEKKKVSVEDLCTNPEDQTTCCKSDNYNCLKSQCSDHNGEFYKKYQSYCDELVCIQNKDENPTCCAKTDIACIRNNKMCKNAKFKKEYKDLCKIEIKVKN